MQELEMIGIEILPNILSWSYSHPTKGFENEIKSFDLCIEQLNTMQYA